MRTFQSLANDNVTKATFKQQANLTVHYQINGTGRDTYIHRDNGGFCKMYQPYPYKYGEVGTIDAGRRRHQYFSPAPVMHPMNVHYKSDGTGRDSYVISTNGGLTGTGRMLHYRDAFKKSLRQYDDPRTTNNFPYVKLGGKNAGFDKARSTNTFANYKTVEPVSVYNASFTDPNNKDASSPDRQQHTLNSPRFQDSPQSNILSSVQQQQFLSSTQASGFFRKKDYLLESQLTYDYKFHKAQQDLRKVQKSMDARLSVPKYSRQASRQNEALNGSAIMNRSINLLKASQNSLPYAKVDNYSTAPTIEALKTAASTPQVQNKFEQKKMSEVVASAGAKSLGEKTAGILTAGLSRRLGGSVIRNRNNKHLSQTLQH